MKREAQSRAGRLATWFAIGSMLLHGLPVQAIPAEDDLRSVIKEMRTTASAYAELYHRDAMLDKSDYEAESIIAFVSDEIAFQPYAGIMRGIEGTLVGRSGNAHDQALTLASLLKDAGFDAQILVGQLTEDQANELVTSTQAPTLPEAGNEKFKSQLLNNAIAQARKHGQSPDDLLVETNRYAETLLTRVRDQGIGDRMLENAISQSVDYRWVRYRDDVSGSWTEIHPAYSNASAWQLKFSTVETDEIDSADVQILSLEVWIEDSRGAQHSVTGPWTAPAPTLMGKPISIEVLSDKTLSSNAWTHLDMVIDESEFFFVQINGNVTNKGRVFDLYGDVLSGSAMEGLDSIFSTLNRRGRKAANALSAMGASSDSDQKANKELAKVWIEFKIEKPGGQTHQIDRVLFEGSGLADRAKTAGQLLQRWDLDVTNTTPLPQYYRATSAGQFADAMDGLDKMQRFLDKPGTASEKEISDRASKWLKSPATSRLTYLRQMFDRFPVPAGHVSYVHEPNLLAIRQGIVLINGEWQPFEMADIVNNRRLSFRSNQTGIQSAPETSLTRGVWETRAEAWRIIDAENSSETSAYTTLTQTDVDDLEAEQLLDGLALSAPDDSSWWQVDAQTGSTIGMQHSIAGTGGQALSYGELLTIGISAIFFLVGTTQCVSATNNVECCVATNASITALGFSLGWAAGIIGVATLGLTGGAIAGGVASVAADISLYFAPVDCS